MRTIQLMDADLANKIAAGEVIENQASVVKELIENSIDAQAKKIDITLIDSGLQLIQVVDNGKGMSKEDLLLCFKQHATSKLTNKYDLFNINTLGFRGEALASIVSIAKVRISTNDQNSSGYNYDINENQLTEGYQNQGSKFSVYNLFYNVPARLKHLKSQKSELANIIDLVAKFALAYPNISFQLVNDGKVLVKTTGKNDLLQVMANIYSLDIIRNMEEIKIEDSDFKIEGFISNSKATRSNKRGINIFLNNRLIYNKEIEDAIISGYGQYLMERRYPIVVLNIECDYQLIDVNVHPAKREVRVSKMDELTQLISTGIQKQFSIAQKEYISKPQTYQPTMEFKYVTKVNDEGINYPSSSSKRKEMQDVKESKYPAPTDLEIIDNDVTQDLKRIVDNVSKQNEIKEEIVQQIEDDMFEEKDEIKREATISLNVIGQFDASYILAQSENGLHLIDQHAAMERINYEKLKARFKEKEIIYQDLLVPIILSLTLAEKTKLLTFKKQLHDIGINIEEQANNDLLIRKLPSWIEQDEVANFVNQTIDYLLELNNVKPLDIRDDDLILASCKMSLKANKILSVEEQQTLLDELILTNNYDHCPHGRPIIITYSKYEVEKMFKRIV